MAGKQKWWSSSAHVKGQQSQRREHITVYRCVWNTGNRSEYLDLKSKCRKKKEWRLIWSTGKSPPKIKGRDVEPTLRLFSLSCYTHTHTHKLKWTRSRTVPFPWVPWKNRSTSVFSVSELIVVVLVPIRRLTLRRQPVGCFTHLSHYVQH